MKLNFSHYKTDYFIGLISLIIIILNTIVIMSTDLIYDEAYSYLFYVLKYDFFSTSYANNHILNTILVFFSSYLFPYNELAIRLPIFLFLLIYLYFAYKIALHNKTLKLLTFLLLISFWPLIPIYFSLARGYGMSASLVLIFIYYFKYKNLNENKNLLIILYLLLFGTYAYPGLLPLVIAIFFYFSYYIYKTKQFKRIKKIKFHLVFLILNFLYLIYFLKTVTASGKPIIGTFSPFIKATLGNIITAYSLNEVFLPTYILYLIFIIFIWVNLWMFYKEGIDQKISFISLLTFIIYYLSSTLSHKPHITERLLVPLYPLIVMSIIETLDFLLKQINKQISYKVVNYLFSLFILIHLFFNIRGFALAFKDPEVIKQRNYYSNQIIQELNLDIKDPNGHWSPCVPFYQRKLYTYPPVKQLIDSHANIYCKATQDMNIYYFEKQKVLLYAASKNIDTKNRFFLFLYPENRKNLKSDRIKYDFNHGDFNWYKYHPRIMFKKLPEYKLAKIKTGQFKGHKWSCEKILKKE